MQFTQCKDASVCCMANDFAVLMACHFVKARPSCRRKLKPKHLPISDRFNQQAIGMNRIDCRKCVLVMSFFLGKHCENKHSVLASSVSSLDSRFKMRPKIIPMSAGASSETGLCAFSGSAWGSFRQIISNSMLVEGTS